MSRIIGGAAGGRRLQMPRGTRTRPTSDRTREGLFSSLGGDLAGRSFLDLFAGSGAVGLEAASRGAVHVVLVERDTAAAAVARGNADELGLSGVDVRAQSVMRYLDDEAVHDAFDVVFIDPPYADPVDEVLARLVAHDRVRREGVVVVERASRGAAVQWPDGLVADRSRRYGDSTLWYGRRP